MKLVILESPTKTKTIRQYLDDQNYCVLSSNGHIKLLNKSGKYKLGVDLTTFEPDFIVEPKKQQLLRQLRMLAKKAETIYLATDPDREGESISYHLNNYLASPKKTKRVFFNEITKTAILKAFQNPTQIDLNLVNSQIARRILDRMIGFRLSNLLQTKIQAPSAGRVQSVGLKLIVERQNEIDAFIPEKTWILSAITNDQLVLKLNKEKKFNKSKSQDVWQKLTIKDQKTFDCIKQKLAKHLIVHRIEKSIHIRKKPSPLTTANLLQLASSKFHFSAKKTMNLAQRLYEGVEINGQLVGLITYPRTDSPRINNDFHQKMTAFITKTWGKEYATNPNVSLDKKQSSKGKTKIQDAHESIHVTGEIMDLKLLQKTLDKDLFRLYQLIYLYSLASIMTNSKVEKSTFELISNNYQFGLEIEKVMFAGFLILLDSAVLQKKVVVPNWKVKDHIKIAKIHQEIKQSKPQSLFSEGTLIKTLEKLGVGRPSTYSQIVSRLILSKYIAKKDNKLSPTKMGVLVNEKLQNNFANLINEKYTADLEKNLDKIATGKRKRLIFLKQFWKLFNISLDQAKKKMENIRGEFLDKECPNCQKNLVKKQGRYGSFISCSGYPECRYIEKIPQEPQKVGKKCPTCTKDLVKKQSRYGPFVSCSGYPECPYIEKTPQESEATGKKCPKCTKVLLKRQGRYGPFISCSGYPECRYIEKTPQEAQKIGKQCPDCKKDLLKKQGRYGPFISCSGYPECRYLEKN